MAVTYRTSSAGGGTSGTGNRTSTITAAAGDLLIVFVQWSGNSATNPTCTDSGDASGGSYALIGTALNNASGDICALFIRTAAIVNATPTITVAPVVGSGTNTAGEIIIIACAGATNFGSAAIRSVSGTPQFGKQANQTTGVPTPILPAAALTGNMTLTSCGSSTTAGSVPNASWTERQDASQITPVTSMEVATRDSGFTGTSAAYVSVASSVWNAMIIELDGGVNKTVAATGSSSTATAGTSSESGAANLTAQLPVFTQTASDNFTRANENPLNASNWANANFLNNLQVVSNKCEATVIANSNSEVYIGISFPNNQYAEVTVPASGTNNSRIGAMVRWNPNTPTNETGYVYYVTFTGGALPLSLAVQPLLVNVGSQSGIGSTFNLTINAGDVLRLAILGNTLYFYQNGTLVDVRVDSTVASGSPGLYIIAQSALTDIQVPLWAAGSVTSQPITATVGSVTESGSDITAATGNSLTSTAGSPSEIGTANVAASGSSVTSTAGTVTTSGNANVSVTGNALTLTEGSVTVITVLNVTVAATGSSISSTAGSTSQAGAANVSVSGSALVSTEGSVSVSIAISVAASGAALTSAMNGVSLAGSASVSATGSSTTSSAGTSSESGTANPHPSGSSAATAVGSASVAGGAAVTVSGNPITASKGTTTQTGTASVSSSGTLLSATEGSVIVSSGISISAAGSSFMSSTGTPMVAGSANVSITGISFASVVGNSTISGAAIIPAAGNLATLTAGTVTVITTYVLVGNLLVSSAGNVTLGGDAKVSVSGNIMAASISRCDVTISTPMMMHGRSTVRQPRRIR